MSTFKKLTYEQLQVIEIILVTALLTILACAMGVSLRASTQSSFNHDTSICDTYEHEETKELCVMVVNHMAEFEVMSSYWFGHMRGETKALRGKRQ